jgi:GTP-binding protein of the ras superfamily involved in termination of M-phase
MEKTISVRRTTITFSIWDLGGQREFVNMLPLVCNDAVAILFMFDLSRKSTLNSVKEWYRQARGFNKVCFFVQMLPVSSLNASTDGDTFSDRHKI